MSDLSLRKTPTQVETNYGEAFYRCPRGDDTPDNVNIDGRIYKWQTPQPVFVGWYCVALAFLKHQGQSMGAGVSTRQSGVALTQKDLWSRVGVV